MYISSEMRQMGGRCTYIMYIYTWYQQYTYKSEMHCVMYITFRHRGDNLIPSTANQKLCGQKKTGKELETLSQQMLEIHYMYRVHNLKISHFTGTHRVNSYHKNHIQIRLNAFCRWKKSGWKKNIFPYVYAEICKNWFKYVLMRFCRWKKSKNISVSIRLNQDM